MPCVNFPWDMKLGRKQYIEVILISFAGALAFNALKVFRFSLCTR